MITYGSNLSLAGSDFWEKFKKTGFYIFENKIRIRPNAITDT